MDGKPPLAKVTTRGLLLAGVVAVLFVLVLLWGMQRGREEARALPPEGPHPGDSIG